MGDFFYGVIMLLLSLDTIRALIAMIGIVKPDSKFGRIIYGRRNPYIVESALKELGFTEQKQKYIMKNFRKLVQDLPKMTGITADNAAVQLIVLLSKYTVKFPDEIRYGEGNSSTSNYYVDTMEISHDAEDLIKLRAIMTYLMAAKVTLKKDVIISPKGGNPVFAQSFASSIHAELLIAKPKDDNSRITGENPDTIDHLKINYEGSWKILNKKIKRDAYIVDCNTADGTQLLDIVSEINRILHNCGSELSLNCQSYVFVLFCANNNPGIDEQFKNHEAELIRYFDLDEQAKEMLYGLRSRCLSEGREPDGLNDDDIRTAKGIIDYLRENNLCYCYDGDYKESFDDTEQ